MRIRTYRSRSSSKYGNRKCKIDGYTFDSIKEGQRYAELKILLRENKIKDLELQKEYELCPAYRDGITGKMVRPLYYKARLSSRMSKAIRRMPTRSRRS